MTAPSHNQPDIRTVRWDATTAVNSGEAGYTLYALADTLGAALGDLIGEPGTRPVEVLRAGEGAKVSGAVSARLLDRILGHRLAEVYEITFATRRRTADPHPSGVVESLLLTDGRLRTARLPTRWSSDRVTSSASPVTCRTCTRRSAGRPGACS